MSLAKKLAEEFINVLKYNPELTHDEKVLSLELRIDKLISDVEKGCEEAKQRQEAPSPSDGAIVFLGSRTNFSGPPIVSEDPNERELTLGAALKRSGPTN